VSSSGTPWTISDGTIARNKTHALPRDIIAERIAGFGRDTHVREHPLELLSELETPVYQFVSMASSSMTDISSFSLATMPFSASSEALRPYSSRRAK